MARRKPTRTKAQAASDRRALKILRDTGLYRSRNIQSASSKTGRTAIKKFQDVIAGEAVVVKPSKPSRYKDIFRVKGKYVVVPRTRGKQHVRVEKGEIVIRTKSGRISRRQKFIDLEKGPKLIQTKNVRYGLPFKEGSSDNYTIRWFPDRAALNEFLTGYEYKDYERWIIEEEIDFEPDYDTTKWDQEDLDRWFKNK